MPRLVVLGARNLGGAIVDRFLADGWEAIAIVRSADTAAAVEERGAQAVALTAAAADELRAHNIHVALLIVNGPIESPKTRRMIAGMPPEAVNDQSDVAAALAGLAAQGARGRTNELTLSPAGRAPAAW
jgi:hypothetical protein